MARDLQTLVSKFFGARDEADALRKLRALIGYYNGIAVDSDIKESCRREVRAESFDKLCVEIKKSNIPVSYTQALAKVYGSYDELSSDEKVVALDIIPALILRIRRMMTEQVNVKFPDVAAAEEMLLIERTVLVLEARGLKVNSQNYDELVRQLPPMPDVLEVNDVDVTVRGSIIGLYGNLLRRYKPFDFEEATIQERLKVFCEDQPADSKRVILQVLLNDDYFFKLLYLGEQDSFLLPALRAKQAIYVLSERAQTLKQTKFVNSANELCMRLMDETSSDDVEKREKAVTGLEKLAPTVRIVGDKTKSFDEKQQAVGRYGQALTLDMPWKLIVAKAIYSFLKLALIVAGCTAVGAIVGTLVAGPGGGVVGAGMGALAGTKLGAGFGVMLWSGGTAYYSGDKGQKVRQRPSEENNVNMPMRRLTH